MNLFGKILPEYQHDGLVRPGPDRYLVTNPDLKNVTIKAEVGEENKVLFDAVT